MRYLEIYQDITITGAFPPRPEGRGFHAQYSRDRYYMSDRIKVADDDLINRIIAGIPDELINSINEETKSIDHQEVSAKGLEAIAKRRATRLKTLKNKILRNCNDEKIFDLVSLDDIRNMFEEISDELTLSKGVFA
jgi:hypothetical protein